MKLYYSPGACSLASRISLHEAGIATEFERERVAQRHAAHELLVVGEGPDREDVERRWPEQELEIAERPWLEGLQRRPRIEPPITRMMRDCVPRSASRASAQQSPWGFTRSRWRRSVGRAPYRSSANRWRTGSARRSNRPGRGRRARRWRRRGHRPRRGVSRVAEGGLHHRHHDAGTPQRRHAAQPELAELDIGLAHLFIRHTSASLVIQENADPDVLRDLLERWLGIGEAEPADSARSKLVDALAQGRAGLGS